MKNLSDLFREARNYGMVNIFTQDDGSYSCTITFNSIAHTEVKARSGYEHKTPENAVQAAIDVAKSIVDSVLQQAEILKQIGRD